MDLLLIFLRPIRDTLLTVGPLLLSLLYALILLLIGLLIAKGSQWLVITALGVLRLNKGSKQIGFTEFLTKGGLKKGPTELLGELVYWLTIFVTVTAVASILGLASAKALLGGLLAYLPAALSAAYVLGVGIFVALLLSAVMLVIANNIGLTNANVLANVVQSAIIIFAALAALGQLGVPLEWLTTSVNIIVGAVGLAFAIAFGLGAKDRAANFLDKFFGEE
ncbi:MAG: hypothetical protein WC632_06350 [Candidatus Margulisiibacteriota bacterium]